MKINNKNIRKKIKNNRITILIMTKILLFLKVFWTIKQKKKAKRIKAKIKFKMKTKVTIKINHDLKKNLEYKM